MLQIGLIAAALGALTSLLVTFAVMRGAGRLGLVQQPNARSSHRVPTPGGGGLGIVAGGVVVAVPTALALPHVAVPVLLAGLLLALIGYWDDRRPIPARYRLGAHVLLTGAVVAIIPFEGLAASLPLPYAELLLLLALTLAGALWINLFNFMDGIDGLAGSEAVFILLGSAFLAVLDYPQIIAYPPFWWMLGLAAATLGFLVLNWPPARIFMGDVGSTYLGLMTAFFAMVGIVGQWFSPWQWLILAALFLVDSLTTLLRRLLRRERVWQAHRSHAYQALQRRFGTHLKATGLYLGINLLLLWPAAWLAGQWPEQGWVATLLVYALLVPAALLAGAGAPSEPEAHHEGASPDDGH